MVQHMEWQRDDNGKQGTRANRGPLEPALQLLGRQRPHISGGLDAETRTFPSARAIPGQTATLGTTPWQGKVRPGRPRADSLLPLPRGLHSPEDAGA